MITYHPAPTTAADRSLPLRERKKLRTRRALADTALRLFIDKGFERTTLDVLVDEVEVSKRTFYAHFASKEDVALAAELELWGAYTSELSGREIHGPVLAVLREALAATLARLGDDWARRFRATRELAARTPALRDHSLLLSMVAQERIVEILENKLGHESQGDIRLRLLGEFSLGAWRCGARNWVARRGPERRRGTGGIETLILRVEEAFDAILTGLALSVP